MFNQTLNTMSAYTLSIHGSSVAILSKSTGQVVEQSKTKVSPRLAAIKRRFKYKLASVERFYFGFMTDADVAELKLELK